MIDPTATARLILKRDGGEHAVTREEILRAMEEFDRGNYPWDYSSQKRGLCVRENGKRYPAKRLISLATHLPLAAFRGVQALNTIGSLGFEVTRGIGDVQVNGEDIEDADSEQVEDALETTFGIERDLQRALRKEIVQLESGLRITDGGKEQNVDSGRIDITAEDRNGATVVIELKAGGADRDAIGQILAYMGDLAVKQKQVRGILVAGEFSPRAIAAARVVPNLQLREYAFKFTFESPKGFSEAARSASK
jgi:hypothetical protein